MRILAAGVAIVLALVSGCSSAHRSHTATAGLTGRVPLGAATVGALRLSGGYLTEPASPDVAAAYLTITNTGSRADRVATITTDVTTSVVAMQETATGGAGTMSDLSAVAVPAHAKVTLSPGHAHLMLERPRRTLRTGDHVALTITFTHAGTVTLTLPVVGLTAPVPAG